jgi:hypothetical protein
VHRQLVHAFLASLLAAGAVGAPASAQTIPLRDLPKPAREIDDPFTAVLGARELRSGLLLVADGGDVTITIVDLARGTKTPLGRQGAGPGEYQLPTGIFTVAGDTIWIVDRTLQRVAVFHPDHSAGTTYPIPFLNAQDTSSLDGPWGADLSGRLYAAAVSFKTSTSGSASDAKGMTAGVAVPDSNLIVRFDPRVLNAPRTRIGRVRTASAGKQDVKVIGTNLKITIPFPGFVPADGWAVFPDGRVAIVRGANYRIEFIGADGKHAAPVTIPYEHFKLTEADRKIEMDAAQKQLRDQKATISKLAPAGYTLDLSMTPPATWPAEYPPISLLGVLAAPDGRLWVKRGVPERIGREQWDVIDQHGRLVARWQLPPKITLIGAGAGVVYTVRKDEDDLQYLQRVELPACKECR